MLAGSKGAILFEISYLGPMGEKLFHLSCRPAHLFGAAIVFETLLVGKIRKRTVEDSFLARQLGG